MKRYLLVVFVMIVCFLIAFGVAELLQIPLLTDPSSIMEQGKWQAAIISTALLVGDVFLPVPSSIVMTMNGRIFGVGVGAGISLIGTMGSAALGFFLGRRGGKILEKVVSPAAKLRADAMLKKYGGLAIVVTRPVPLLAEVMTILAGTSDMSWRVLILSALVGSIPSCLLYALAGASSGSVGNSFLIWFIVLATGGILWWLGEYIVKKRGMKAE